MSNIELQTVADICNKTSTRQPTEKAKSFGEGVPDSEDFNDELADEAQPLPPADEDDGCGRPTGGGRKLAKDKRKLREKRRSTGIVEYTAADVSEVTLCLFMFIHVYSF
jgi:hypothetical protein